MARSYLHQYSSVLRITGPDANSFLQGQFTNDLRGDHPLVRYGLWLNHKGRVQGDGFVLSVGAEEFLAVSYCTESASIKAHLESFIVADDVALEDETGHWMGLSLWGDNAGRAAQQLGMPVPTAGQCAAWMGGYIFGGRRAAGGSLDCLLPAGRLDELRLGLPASGAVPVSPLEAERERIAGGIPAVPVDIGPGDLPAEGGLDEAAVSFTKGCFLGQEVVARLKNLGQPRRRLEVVVADRARLNPGDLLHQGDARVGEVRSAAPAGDGEGSVAMAMMSLLHWRPAEPLALAPGAEPVVFLRRA